MIRIDFLHHRLFFALVFGLLFTVVGQMIPYTFYKYFDNHTYVSIDLPVDTDLKVYNPCDKIILSTQLNSDISTSLNGIVQLTMFRSDNKVTPVDKVEFKDVVINKGAQPYGATLEIPCDLPEGVYYYEGLIKYNVHDNEKQFYFYTGKINVVARPLAPKPGKEDI